jgi:hypothetical protein
MHDDSDSKNNPPRRFVGMNQRNKKVELKGIANQRTIASLHDIFFSYYLH